MLRIAVTAQPRGVGLVNTIGFYKGQPYASDFVRAHVRKGIAEPVFDTRCALDAAGTTCHGAKAC